MHDKHEHHHWLIAVLAACVLLLTAVVAFFGYQLFFGDTVIYVNRSELNNDALDETLATQRDQLEQYLQESTDQE